MSESHCIFRVPSILKRQNEEAYIPKFISIGPFHRHREEPSVPAGMKLKYARGIADRGTGDKLREVFAVIEEVENEIRASYGGSTDDVVVFGLCTIMVLDGCFIVELLRKFDDEKVRDEDDPIFNNYCMLEYLRHDLILLENQIPWLVLKRLFNTIKKPGEKPLNQLALNFFSRIFPSTPPVLTLPHREPDHILDLLRDWLVSSSREVERVKPWQTIPSASQLSYAGITFRKGWSNGLDITFINGVLQIPQLLIGETTQVAIRNLVIYEQLTHKFIPKIASYTKFLGDLIITVADVDILSKNDIIGNCVNPEDATRFFKQLHQDVYSLQAYCYVDLCKKINDYFRRKRAKRRAMFIRNYFSTPLGVAYHNLRPDLSDLDDCTNCTF